MNCLQGKNTAPSSARSGLVRNEEEQRALDFFKQGFVTDGAEIGMLLTLAMSILM